LISGKKDLLMTGRLFASSAISKRGGGGANQENLTTSGRANPFPLGVPLLDWERKVRFEGDPVPEGGGEIEDYCGVDARGGQGWLPRKGRRKIKAGDQFPGKLLDQEKKDWRTLGDHDHQKKILRSWITEGETLHRGGGGRKRRGIFHEFGVFSHENHP